MKGQITKAWIKTCFGVLFFLGLLEGSTVLAQGDVLKVGVLKNSPPMSFRDEQGELSGFNVEISLLLCQQMKVKCRLMEVSLDQVIDDLAQARMDFVAASLFETPERGKKVLFTRPYYRSNSYWVINGDAAEPLKGAKIAVVAGSREADYVLAHKEKWQAIEVKTNVDLQSTISAGKATTALAPLGTAVNLYNAKVLRARGFRLVPVETESLSGPAKIAVTPSKPKLRDALDKALLEVGNSSQFEKINSKYFPFRVY